MTAFLYIKLSWYYVRFNTESTWSNTWRYWILWPIAGKYWLAALDTFNHAILTMINTTMINFLDLWPTNVVCQFEVIRIVVWLKKMLSYFFTDLWESTPFENASLLKDTKAFGYILCNNPYWTLLVTSRRNNAVSERHTNGKTATILEIFVTVDETFCKY